MNHSKDTRHVAAPTYAMYEAGSTPLAEDNLAGVASAILELGIRPINSSRSSYRSLAKVSSRQMKLKKDSSSCSTSGDAHRSHALGYTNMGAGSADPGMVGIGDARRMDVFP